MLTEMLDRFHSRMLLTTPLTDQKVYSHSHNNAQYNWAPLLYKLSPEYSRGHQQALYMGYGSTGPSVEFDIRL